MESDFDFNDVLWTLGCYDPNPEVARHNFCEKMKEVGFTGGHLCRPCVSRQLGILFPQ